MSRATYVSNKARRIETSRAWQAANREKVNAIARASRRRNPAASLEAVRRWQAKNPERRKSYRREFRKVNPEFVARSELRRKRALKQACVSWGDRSKMRAVYREARRRTADTGEKWEVDHVVPLRHRLVCGLHAYTNLQIIRQSENRIKSNVTWPDKS